MRCSFERITNPKMKDSRIRIPTLPSTWEFSFVSYVGQDELSTRKRDLLWKPPHPKCRYTIKTVVINTFDYHQLQIFVVVNTFCSNRLQAMYSFYFPPVHEEPPARVCHETRTFDDGHWTDHCACQYCILSEKPCAGTTRTCMSVKLGAKRQGAKISAYAKHCMLWVSARQWTSATFFTTKNILQNIWQDLTRTKITLNWEAREAENKQMPWWVCIWNVSWYKINKDHVECAYGSFRDKKAFGSTTILYLARKRARRWSFDNIRIHNLHF